MRMNAPHNNPKPDSQNDAARLYAITNRHLLQANARDQNKLKRTALLALARRWAARNLDYIQIREKDLAPEELRELTQAIVSAVRASSTHTRVLLNGPADVALEAGADGIHLPGNTVSGNTVPGNTVPSAAAEARRLFAQSGREAVVSHSCHSVNEVLKVREESQRDPHATAGNTLILYAPVFEKVIPNDRIPGHGLDALRAAVHAGGNIPVFALGGVTKENAPACLAAGAAGIAGIRFFLEEDWQALR